MKIIILNGPPKSGKDSLADRLAERIPHYNNAIYFSIKHVLCLGVAKRYNLNPLSVWQINADPDIKDDPLDIFDGKSVRQALIYESEEVIKKEHGEQGVIIKALEDLKRVYSPEVLRKAILICADGGFNSEIPSYGEILGCPEEDIYVVRVMRKGRTFEGDSREFIDNPKFVFRNDSELEDFLRRASTTIIQEAGLNIYQGEAPAVGYMKEHPDFL